MNPKPIPATKLIKELEKAVRKNGDGPVFMEGCAGVEPVIRCGVEKRGQNWINPPKMPFIILN